MEKLLKIFLLIFLTNTVYSQSLIINCNIFDEEETAIPYVNIYIEGERKGTVIDKFGQFELNITQEDFSKKLIISAIGFESKKLVISALPNKIILKKSVYNLEEIVVFSGEEKIIEIGNLEFPKNGKIPDYLSVGQRIPTGFQNAMFIENPTSLEGRFKTVSFFIAAKGKHKTPFRIKVYGKDGIEEKPDSLLVQKDIIVKANKKGDWFQIDVSSYNIPFPENGAYIAMEWLHNEKKYRYKRKFKHRNKKTKIGSYGQGLGAYSTNTNYECWFYYLGHGWKKDLLTHKPLIKAEVAIYE